MRTIRWRGFERFSEAGSQEKSRIPGLELPNGFARAEPWDSLSLQICALFGLTVLLFGLSSKVSAAPGLQQHTLEQIEIVQQEKALRTPAQKKIDSQLLYALREKRQGFAVRNVRSLKSTLAVEPDGRVLVDIDAEVAPSLKAFIEQAGGVIVSSVERYHTIRALIPLDQVEALASQPQVRSIRPADQATTNTAVVSYEGVVAHQVDLARTTFGADGTGVKVGVLSDSVDYLTALQSTGQLAIVTVLPGQGGSGTGEGTAMLEIVHAVAPGADLYFATAFNGVASFAQNIRALQAAGCKVIVDDVTYFNESPFQDGPIAKAVNAVCSAGSLYFSAAANSGNVDHGTAGTWEGDFKDGGPATIGRGGRVHDFGGVTYNTVRPGGGTRRVDCFWSDPLGSSTNDYDVYILDGTGAVVRSSTNTQDGQQDPYEAIPFLNVGESIVIVKYSGEDRYLWLSSGRGYLSLTTPGSTRGHNATRTPNSFTIAATAVSSPPTVFTGGNANPVEPFSSDGPRRMFYNPDGSAITPGNYSSTGGMLLAKPDLTAADGVSTSVPGLNPFFGTSAATPHAAAIAALLWSYSPFLTPAAVRQVLTNATLDIEAPGWDRDSGAGIVMAYPALAAVPVLKLQSVQMLDANTDGNFEANECVNLEITLQNTSTNQGVTGITASLSSPTAGVLVDPAPRSFPDLTPGGRVSAASLFLVSSTPAFVCGSHANLVLNVSAAGGLTYAVPFQLPSTVPLAAPASFASTDPSTPIPDLGSITSQIPVSGITAPVGKVKVSLYVTHAYDYDLRFTVIGPDGTSVVLSSNNGGAGQNYGADCSSNMTVFADDGSVSIDAASAPFIGTFQPDQPLSAFIGKSGTNVNGTWTLLVEDQVVQDTGTYHCWSLELSPVAPCDGGGQCLVGPSIVQNPTNRVVYGGEDVQLAVTAQGSDPLSYQWVFHQTTLLSAGTNATLSLTNVSTSDSGTYQVLVTNPYGNATSAPVQLLVMPSLFVSQPADITVTNGDVATFSVTAQGTEPLAYQWYSDVTNRLDSGTNSTLVLSNVAPVQAGSYQVVLSNAYGSVTSAPAQLTVLLPATILSGPFEQLATNGDTVFISVSAVGTDPLTYQWYFDATNTLAQGTYATLILSNVTLAQAGTYGVVVSNAYGVASNAAVLSVIVLPTITCGTNRTVELGSAWTFDVPSFTGNNATLTVLNTVTNSGCSQTYTATRSWVVTDQSNYQANCSQTVQVVQTNPPVMSCAGDKMVVYGTAWSFDVPTAQDAEAQEVLVYDNTANDEKNAFSPATAEVGNEVTLSGTERYVSQFSLGYWGSNSVQEAFGGEVRLRVRFYNNDGPSVSGLAAPGTLLYDSGALPIVATNSGLFVLTDFEIGASLALTGTVPSTLTWSAQFSGLGANDTAGLNLFGPPTVGQAVTKFWEQRSSGWSLRSRASATPDFQAQITAADRSVVLAVLNTVTNADCGNGFTAARAWQAVDACRNISTCTQTVAVVDHGPPALTAQPESQIVPIGQMATFSAGVSACPPLTYQWFFNRTNILDAATNTTLEITNATTADSGIYSLVVSNTYGSVTSAPATLTVSLVPAIFVTGPDNELATNGETAVISVTAQGGGPFTYQWYFNTTNIVADGTNAALVFSNVTPAQAGSYLVTVSNPYGSVTSAPAVLTVVSPAFIVSDPTNQVVTNGTSATFIVDAQGDPPLAYQWYFNVTNSLDLETNSTLVLSNVALFQAGFYQVVVSNAYGSVTSAPAQLTVLLPATILSGPFDQLATNGDTVFISVSAAGTAPLSYQWYFDATNTLLQGTNATLILSNVTPALAGTYGVVVSNAYGLASNGAVLSVIVLPTITCGTNRTVELGTAWTFDVPSFTGSNATLTVVSTVTNSGCGLTYTAARTWVVTDQSNYQANCSQTVQVVQTNPPVMSCAGDKMVVYGTAWSFDGPTAKDAAAQEVVVYDNTANDQQSAFSLGTNEIGNEVTLSGTERYVSQFSLSYWGSNSVQAAFSGGVRLRVRFYSNDGPVTNSGAPAPGTMLYDSGAVPVVATNGGTLVLSDFQLNSKLPLTGALPHTFTWTAQFSGLDSNDTAGLLLYGPPAVGQALTNYWENSDPGWLLQTNGNGPAEFAAQVTASAVGVTLSVLNTLTNADCGNGFSAARAWQAVDACGNLSTCTQTVAVVDHGAPMITAQPQSQIVLVGDTATFSPGISACPPLAYQWYFNTSNALAAGTNANLVISNVTTADTGQYTLVVSNTYGSVTSAPALLTVVLAPSILSGPADQAATNGDAVSFSVTAQGNQPLSYQWYFDGTNSLHGETNSTLVLSNITLLQAGMYQVVITNDYGSVTSAPAQLTVIAVPEIITGPTDQVGTNGDTVQFAVQADGTPPLTYQWIFNGTQNLPQGTGATLTLANVTPTQAGSYAVVVNNSYGSITSAPAQLTVVIPATIINAPANQVTTNGDTVFFTVTAQGTAPLTYQWYFNQTNPIAGAISPTLMLNNVSAVQAGTYLVVVANPYGTASATAQLIVDVPAIIVTNPTNQVVTSGSTALFAVTAAGTDPLYYQWFLNATNPLTSATQSVLQLLDVSSTDSGIYSVTVTNAFGSATSQAAALRVLVPPQLISLTRNQNVISLTFSTVTNLLYSVYYLDDLNTTNWTLLPKESGLLGTGAPITVQDPRANGAQRFYRLVVQ